MLLGNPVTVDLIGIAVGHAYFFLDFVFPAVADLRAWRLKRLVRCPWPLSRLNQRPNVIDAGGGGNQGVVAGGGGGNGGDGEGGAADVRIRWEEPPPDDGE